MEEPMKEPMLESLGEPIFSSTPREKTEHELEKPYFKLIIGRNHPNGGASDPSSSSGVCGGWGGDAVHVAVGKSVEKTAALLRWSFNMFSGQEIVLLHVHRPSPLIPTLLGKLPASRANPAMVAAFRNEEREETMKLLSTYLMICSRSRVKASIITTESDEVQKGIVNLVNRHGIRKLVVGAIPDFMKGKRTSGKACHVVKHAPSYCEMWFVDKGKLIWTRQASSSSNIRLPSCQLPLSFNSAKTSSGNEYATSVEPRVSSVSSSKTVEECLCIRLAELKGEVDESRDEAYLKLIEPKKLEDEALEAFNKVKALEMAHSDEVKLRVDAEDALTITIQAQEKLLEERQKITQQLQMTMRNIALLDSRAHEANRRCEEVAGELKLIQASIAALRTEKHKLQGQKIEATRWLDRWRNHEQCDDANESRVIGLPELLLSDLEVATCNFSESFRIGQGGCGIVYKGEMLGKTVVIKKLHSYNMQRQTEFHKAVQVLASHGKTHGGLVGEVRRALSVGKVASVWDLSAGDWSTYAARRLVELGLQCCESNGRDRPELTPSLVKELERMPFLEEQTVPSFSYARFFVCSHVTLISSFQEIMHDPQVAADGFTYEGDALRGWLESGRETSPMTNLRLSHSNLVPNHSLRLAIQDWLANLEIAS
ncbi:hypothetical protein DH2020_006963 [Rehmannia glutinosa]|uniref:RING-type E3 ubiquitin transferase n=1 Tax=Rehmannia glutinosa TaxID=99300 RepID=A0ABR0W793_REHGL